MLSNRRALARIARRGIVKAPQRSLLIVVLIALVVAVGATVAIMDRSSSVNADDGQTALFGNAETLIAYDPVDRTADGYNIVSEAIFAPPDVFTLGGTVQHPTGLDGEAAQLRGFVADDTDTAVLDAVGGNGAGRTAVLTRRGFLDQVNSYGGPFGAFRAVSPIVFVDVDAQHPLVGDQIELVEGRLPAGPNEVAITPRRSEQGRLAIGDGMYIPGGSLEIVGLVTAPTGKSNDFGLVSSAGFDALDFEPYTIQHRILTDLSFDSVEATEPLTAELEQIVGHPVAVLPNDEFEFTNTIDSRAEAIAVSTFASIFASILVIMVAASAFAVSIRRRLTEIGQLGAIGADAKHLRRLLRFEALWLGLAGVVLGSVLAVGASYLLVDLGWFRDTGTKHVSSVRLAPIDLVGPALIGLLAAVTAARYPAQVLDKIPPAAALAGHIPVKPPVRYSLKLGLALVAFGLGGLGVLGNAGTSLAVLTVFAIPVGVLAIASVVLAAIGKRAGRFGLLPRLVVRDADRNRGRATMLVGAFAVILIAPVLMGASLEGYPVSDQDAGESLSPIVATVIDEDSIWSRPFVGTSAEDADDRAERERAWDSDAQARYDDAARQLDAMSSDLVAAAEESFGPISHAPLEKIDEARVYGRRSDGTLASVGRPGPGAIFVATPEVLDLLEVDASVRQAMSSGAVLVYKSQPQTGSGGASTFASSGDANDTVDGADGPDETAIASVVFYVSDTEVPVELIELDGSTGLIDGVFASPDLADGVETHAVGTIYRSADPLTSNKLDVFQQRANEAWVERNGQYEMINNSSGWSEFRFWHEFVPIDDASTNRRSGLEITLGLAAAIAALIAVAAAVLGAVEVDRDIRVMIATGAAPSLRRKLLGAQTLYYGLLGAAFAIPLGLIIFHIVAWSDEFGPNGLVIPWTAIGGALLIPLVVAVAMAVFFRSGTPALSRRTT